MESSQPAPIRPTSTNVPHSHAHTRSLSPTGGDGHGFDSMLDEDDNDVFSNPDTAELESSRSDATGATSPAPNSPGPSSPSSRAGIVYHPSHNMAATTAATNVLPPSSDHFATLKQTSHDSTQTRQGAPMLTLGSLPPARFEQPGHAQGQAPVQTPRATTTTTTTAAPRPQFGRTVSASGLPHRLGSHTASTMAPSSSPRIHGHSASHSASQVSLSLSGQLPSAHGLPSDPKEAMTMSKLFAHPPAQSPAEELSGFLLAPQGGTHMRSSFSAAGSSSTATTPLVGQHGHQFNKTPSSSRFLSRTRPSSPDRLAVTSSPSRSRSVVGVSGLLPGLPGFSPRPPTASDADAAMETGSSIFERDIEHRDSHHVMSKQEAVDVAIPSVLDDAVEAITSDEADQLEIVAPHASPPPLALSAQALSAHSHVQATRASSASSPISSPSPPLSSAGGVEPPPGSMAAQIAERLAPNSRTTTTTTAAAAAAAAAGASSNDEQAVHRIQHRRPNSDVSISSSSSMRSRPQHSTTIGVQQVLDQSPSPPMRPNRIVGTSVFSSPTAGLTGHAHTKSTSSSVGPGAAPKSGSGSHTNLASLGATSGAPVSHLPKAVLPTATQLPSLPMPNPFRPSSPGLGPQSMFGNDPAGVSAVPSLSMDGAVMPSSESATKDASLAGLADAITSQPASRTGSFAATHTKGLGLDDGVGLQHLTASIAAASINEPSPYGTRSPRSPQSSMAASPKSPASPLIERKSRGSIAQHSSLSPSSATMPSTAVPEAAYDTSSVNASPSLSKKRLSFFSYADIINKTPAEVIDFDAATRGAGAPHHAAAAVPIAAEPAGSASIMARSQSAGPRSQ